MSANIYGSVHSLMTFDFKLAKSDFRPDELQRMMTIRREANFYDIAPDIVGEAMAIAESVDYRIVGNIIPPTKTGYMRLTFNDGVPMLLNDIPRINALLWSGNDYYLVHDTGEMDEVALSPFKTVANVSTEEIRMRQVKNPEYFKLLNGTTEMDPAKFPEYQRFGIAPISDLAVKEMLPMHKRAVEEMMVLARIIFDMLSDHKVTTVERKIERNNFGSKQREFFERVSVIKLHLHKSRIKYLREYHEKTGRTNAWHEVRSHFRHRRVTKPDCQHLWVHRYAEDDGKHYKCNACGEIKTRIEFPNGAGDKSKGKIKHNYEVMA